MSIVTESHLAMPDGTQLFIRDWFPKDNQNMPQPCVVILHGLCEHSARYDHIVVFFNNLGFAVRTYDHRGHGQSEGKRGDCPDSLSMISDAETMINDFAKRCQTLPLLFGHSMGGLFTARIATANHVALRGVILSSPALALRMTWWHHILLKLLFTFAPHLAVKVSFNPYYLSHKLATVVAYLSDPLVHQQLTASVTNSILVAGDFAAAHAAKLSVPLLLLVAQEDYIVDPQGSRDFFRALPEKLATAHFYAEDYHEIFNEIDTTRVFSDLRNWLAAQQFIQ